MNAAVREAVKKELPPARILECTVEEYHKDPCATPSLSSSTAKVMVSQSPLHAWSRHPKGGQAADAEEELQADDKDTKAKANGQLVHRLILGKGTDLVIVDAKDWRTNYAKDARDEAKAAGKQPVLAARFEELSKIAAILTSRCADLGYEFNGESEVPVEWYEQGAAGPVICRSMIDHLWLDHGKAVDVKTIRSANPRNISRSFVENGYDIQDRAYTRAIAQLRPKLKGRVELDFLFMEIEAPYAVVPYIPPAEYREIGKQRWGRAVSLWETCLAKNEWPSYCTGPVKGDPIPWVVAEHLGREWQQ